jgi:hypothetical protein
MLFNDIIPHSRMPKSLTVPSPSCLLKTWWLKSLLLQIFW